MKSIYAKNKGVTIIKNTGTITIAAASVKPKWFTPQCKKIDL